MDDEVLETGTSIAAEDHPTEESVEDSPAYDSTVAENSLIEQVEEIDEQGYSTSIDLEKALSESSDMVLDDLPIDSLVVESTKPLSIEQAKEFIPKEALKILKDKFNGHLENCRPIQDYDRMI